MLDGLVDPIGEATDTCDAEDQCHCAETFKPCGVGQRQVVFVLYRTKKKLAYDSEDIDCCYHDRACGCDYKYSVECICFLNEPKKIVISATNPESPGRPSDAKPAIM